jgi:FG-GAP-like repeat/Kre9/KNH-like N-terminal Ig-like domain
MRALSAAACLASLWVAFSRPVTAQSGVTITSPAVNTVLASGPDFATDVVGDAWDFNNRLDFALENTQNLGWASGPTLSGGLVSGTSTASSNVSIGLLQRPWSMFNNPGRNGRNFPIDTAKYSKLSIKTSSTASGQFPRFYWWHKEIGDPADPGGGTRLIPENNLPATPGTNLFVIDLINVPANAGPGAPAWNAFAFVKGLGFYPNSGNASNNVSVDWVRLTAGDSRPEAAKMNITWTGGTGSIDVSVSEKNTGVTYKIATVSASNGSIPAWNYGVLPPGVYTLHVGAATRDFTVNGAPVINVTDPDETGGEDFATAILGNPWDMTDPNDYFVNVNIVDHLTQHITNQNGFTGTSDGALVSSPPPVGDAQLYLLSKQKTSEGPVIDSNKYHRLTYTLTVDHPYNLGTGSVARVFWGSQSNETMPGGTPYNVTTSKDIQVWEGTNTYTLDLATLTVANSGLEPNNATVWNAAPIRHFRIDPFEFPEVVTFHLANVKLAADDATTGGKFTIHWSGSDPEGDATTVSLYYDTDQNPGNGMTLIASGLPLSAGQYLWKTGTRVPAGTYFIYAVANDGRNSTGRYSTGPVKVVTAPLPLSAGDFDGDTLGDLALYKSNGDWAIKTSGSGYTSSIAKTWGGPDYTPVPGDYDGDGKQDIAVYRESAGQWSILKSSTNYTTVLTINWGGPGYKPMPGDYDGDGKTDAGVYRVSSGAWSILTSSSGYASTISVAWGGPGYVPIGGQDFDGDGRSDIGVYQPATAAWSILKSNSNYTAVLSASWGGPGYALVPGDYDGDGKADFGVYQQSTSLWLVLKSSSNYSTTLSIGWGGGGYIPVPGDYDGDGVNDLAVFQRSTGNWLVLRSSSNFTTSFTISGWGAATDVPVTSAIVPVGDTTRATDFDGDSKADITVFQSATATWLTLKSTGNYTTSMSGNWGGGGYTLAPGDYDGDGKADFGVYQPSTGNWYVLLSGSGFTTSLSKAAGGPGWIAVPGDYDGDGRTDFAVYNTSSGLWYALKSGSNYTTTLSVTWGGSGYTVAPGDFDGDGKTDLGLYVPASATWYVLLSGANYTTSLSKVVGGSAYVAAQSDYDGDGKADFGVYNPTTGLWYALKSGSNYTTTLSVSWGGPGYTPMRGDYDGDGKQDLALYQASSASWYVLLSGSNYTTTLTKAWGGSGYVPVPTFP